MRTLAEQNKTGTIRYSQFRSCLLKGRAAEAGGFIESPRGVWNKETEHVGSSVALGR
jgi:hypothetical protein